MEQRQRIENEQLSEHMAHAEEVARKIVAKGIEVGVSELSDQEQQTDFINNASLVEGDYFLAVGPHQYSSEEVEAMRLQLDSWNNNSKVSDHYQGDPWENWLDW